MNQRVRALYLKKIIQEIADETKKFSATYIKKMQGVQKDVETISSETKFILIIAACISLIFSIFVSILLSRSITKPVALGLSFANMLAKGDLRELTVGEQAGGPLIENGRRRGKAGQ